MGFSLINYKIHCLSFTNNKKETHLKLQLLIYNCNSLFTLAIDFTLPCFRKKVVFLVLFGVLLSKALPVTEQNEIIKLD